MKATRMLAIWVLGLVVCLSGLAGAAPMGTAFSYQGRLVDANSPADGLYDLQFKLFDDPNVIIGTQLGSTIDMNELDIIEGYFTVALDFGGGIFDGNAVWLEICVRPGELGDPNEYTILWPRQKVTPTPYAIYAKAADAARSLRAADGSPTTTVYVHSEGNVGIGTMSPTEKLHVDGNVQVDGTLFASNISSNSPLSLQTAGTTHMYIDDVSSYVGIGTTAPSKKLEVSGGDIKISDAKPEYFFADTTPGDDDWSISVNENEMQFSQTVGDAVATERVRIDSQGNVGIGITNPLGKLHVHTPDPGIGTELMITSEVFNIFNHILFGEGFLHDGGIVWGAKWSVIGAVAGDLRFAASGDLPLGDLDSLISNPHMRITESGDIAIGKMVPTQKLDVAGTVQMTGFKMPTSATNGYVLTSDASGVGTWQAAAGGGGIGGSGTTNYVPKFTGSTTLGNSAIYETGGNIGIGTTIPTSKLHVSGNSGNPILTATNSGSGIGLRGEASATQSCNVYDQACGVYGKATGAGGVGVYGNSADVECGKGVVGTSPYIGVYGKHPGTGNYGYLGSSGYGVYGYSSSGWAGYFYGNTYVSGKVGIGTTSPGAKLDVHGDIRLGDGSGTDWKLRKDGVLYPLADNAGRIGGASARVGHIYVVTLHQGDSEFANDFRITERGALPEALIFKNPEGKEILVLNEDGNVGIGDTSPSYRLELPNNANTCGRGRANAWVTYSSRRWKENIKPIENALDKVKRLRGVYFDWKQDGSHDVGMVAEEVGEVIPEVVDYEANGVDAASLSYGRLVALLIEAVKEQQRKIAELEATIAQTDSLRQRLEALERTIQQQQLTFAKDVQQ